jgi:hypothetical protein
MNYINIFTAQYLEAPSQLLSLQCEGSKGIQVLHHHEFLLNATRIGIITYMHTHNGHIISRDKFLFTLSSVC